MGGDVSLYNSRNGALSETEMVSSRSWSKILALLISLVLYWCAIRGACNIFGDIRRLLKFVMKVVLMWSDRGSPKVVD